MKDNWISYPMSIRLMGPPALFEVPVAGVFGSTWLPLVDGRAWQILLPAMLLATAVLAFGRLPRAHSARRLKAAMDAYAEREIARTRRRQAMEYAQKNRNHEDDERLPSMASR
jgi:hypothetical protein